MSGCSSVIVPASKSYWLTSLPFGSPQSLWTKNSTKRPRWETEITEQSFNFECWGSLICVFKNWKLLFKNIFENMCRWKNVLKYVKCYLKTENGYLKIQTKHPLRHNCPSPFHQTQFTKYISRRLWEKERDRSKEGTEKVAREREN